jgi:hypothetical protein
MFYGYASKINEHQKKQMDYLANVACQLVSGCFM